MLTTLKKQIPSRIITADASGNLGCGTLLDSQWFQVKSLPHHSEGAYPNSHCCSSLGRQMEGMHSTTQVRQYGILNSGSSQNSEAMHLMRCLAFIQARWHLGVSAEHIPGIHNTLADALTRNKLVTFHSVFPQATKQLTLLLEALVDLLIISRPDWASPQWSTLWNNIFFCQLSCLFLERPTENSVVLSHCPRFQWQIYAFTTSTIKVYQAAVCQLQIIKGERDPKIAKMPRLMQVLRGISTQAANQLDLTPPSPLRYYMQSRYHGKQSP